MSIARFFFCLTAGFGILTPFFYALSQSTPQNTAPAPGGFRIAKNFQLTQDSNYYMRPIWSPDGTMIAFTRAKSTGIEIMNADGSNRRTLSEAPGAGYKFAWAPDSAEIAFRTINFTNGVQSIHVVDVKTSNTESVSEPANNIEPPQWMLTEAGKEIRYVSNGALHKSKTRPLREENSKSKIDKNRPTLYFDKRNIWAYEPGKEKPRQITSGIGFDPVFSPDGSKIVYSQLDTLMIMDANGKNKKRLCLGNHPSWSPDGKNIVFQITRDHSHDPNDPRQHTADTEHHKHHDKTNHRIEESDLFVINANGTGLMQLTTTTNVIEVDPQWSPDGKRIVYRTEDTGQIYLLELE